jgi:hypothetical protein
LQGVDHSFRAPYRSCYGVRPAAASCVVKTLRGSAICWLSTLQRNLPAIEINSARCALPQRRVWCSVSVRRRKRPRLHCGHSGTAVMLASLSLARNSLSAH